MTNLEKQLIEESKTDITYHHMAVDGERFELRQVTFLDDSEEAKEIFKRSYEHKVGKYILLKDSKGRKVVISEIEGPRQS